jgi:hypothetical protein
MQVFYQELFKGCPDGTKYLWFNFLQSDSAYGTILLLYYLHYIDITTRLPVANVVMPHRGYRFVE